MTLDYDSLKGPPTPVLSHLHGYRLVWSVAVSEADAVGFRLGENHARNGGGVAVYSRGGVVRSLQQPLLGLPHGTAPEQIYRQ